MLVDGTHFRTIWLAEDGWSVEVIDQTRLPHAFEVRRLTTVADAADAIRTMVVRGAPLIGATAAYGVCLAMHEDASDGSLDAACSALIQTRPTAVNLRWALDEMRLALEKLSADERVGVAYARAAAICDADVETNRGIGAHGLPLIQAIYERTNAPVNVLTHCNAGWLAAVDWGMSSAPVFAAHDAGIPVHVWVDETRPRNQGAGLTAWEFVQHGVPHTVIVDNAGGHLMQSGQVDLCITGTDRTTSCGDVCNKIGTYLKALAANDNDVPFYVALPSSTIDWTIDAGVGVIPIEQRDGDEVARVTGRTDDGDVVSVTVTPEGTPVANHAFDVTPARLVTALITDRGVCAASRAALAALYPDRGQGGAA